MPADTAASPPEASPAKAPSGSDSEYTRLHITPFDAELFKVVIPTAAAAHARNVSYHTIETFPERRYGFVELPQMEADKVKKRLHGSVLKGAKVRIEKARPEERVEPTGEEDEKERKKKNKKNKSKPTEEGEDTVMVEVTKKRKRDPDVVEGFALKDRKVKRGWTEATEPKRRRSKKDKDGEKDGSKTEKKKRLKSKYTEQEECLLKTKVPPNAVANITEDSMPKKRRKNKSKSQEVTVHEFEKTTKFPSFLKNTVPETAGKPATGFVDGKGWVDEDGNVVEAVKSKRAEPKPIKTKPVVEKKKQKHEPVEEKEEDNDSDTSSSGTSSSGTSSNEDSSDDEVEAQDDSSVAEEEEDSPQQPEHATPISAMKTDDSRPISSSSSKSLTIKIPPPITPSATKVHPLEALYKRAKPDEATAATETPAQEPQPFSFFDGDDDDIEEDEDNSVPPANVAAAVPLTPFTRQDLEWRTTRSAAPTPDTAHPSRMQNFWPRTPAKDHDSDDDMDHHGGDDDDAAQEDGEGDEEDDGRGQQKPSADSDFQAWFWENRRDLNRSWMKRRKTVAKEKRHRENKARASRAV